MKQVNAKNVKCKFTGQDDDDHQPAKRPRIGSRALPLAAIRPPLRYPSTPEQVDLRSKRDVLLARMEWENLFQSRPHLLKTKKYLDKMYKSKMIHRGNKSLIFAGKRLSDGLAVVIKRVPCHANALCYPEPGQAVVFEAAVMEFLNRSRTSMTRETVPKLLATYRCGNEVFIVMKACTATVNLAQFCNDGVCVYCGGRFSEDMAKHIILQLYGILFPMAKFEGVYHGNLTAENVLIDLNDVRIQLIDFNWADNYQSNLYYRTDGVAEQQLSLPPEAYEGDRVFHADSATTYALGVLLYRILAKGRVQSFDADSLARGTWDMPRGLSPQCQEVLSACLAPKPKRVAFTDLAAMKWFGEPVNLGQVHEEAVGNKLHLHHLLHQFRFPKRHW